MSKQRLFSFKDIRYSIKDKIKFTIGRTLRFLLRFSWKIKLKRLNNKKIKVGIFVSNFNGYKNSNIIEYPSKKWDFYLILLPEIGRHDWQEEYRYLINQPYHYNTISAYDIDNNKWKYNTLKDIDLVIYGKHFSKNYFLIFSILTKLSIYIPYSLYLDKNYKAQYCRLFHFLVYLYYVPTNYHYDLAKKKNKLINVREAAYPTTKKLLSMRQQVRQKNNVILWAPHWSIDIYGDNKFSVSAFLLYFESFKELAQYSKYKIIFRPHPYLKENLIRIWGFDKTNAYFNFFKSKNMLSINDYLIDFAESDLIITDSISFMSEYLLTGKPLIHTSIKDKNYNDIFDSYGKKIYDSMYKCYSIDEVKNQIKIIFEENFDPKNHNRQKIINQYFINQKSILEDLTYEINKKSQTAL